ncbi:MAG TPA: hypothetical protein VE152_03865 [Acidimicrobiales bacterium]|nr:hypothetical protein [Acidimicrobiales bacterium]
MFGHLCRVLTVPSTSPGFDVRGGDAASGPWALAVLTVAGGVGRPLVLADQALTCHLFRRRLTSPRADPLRPGLEAELGWLPGWVEHPARGPGHRRRSTPRGSS